MVLLYISVLTVFLSWDISKRKHKPDLHVLQKETTIIGVDGVARRYNTDEQTIRKWLIDNPF